MRLFAYLMVLFVGSILIGFAMPSYLTAFSGGFVWGIVAQWFIWPRFQEDTHEHV